MVARWAVTVVSSVIVSAHMSDNWGNTYQGVRIYNAEVVDHVALRVRMRRNGSREVVTWLVVARSWVLSCLYNGGGSSCSGVK